MILLPSFPFAPFLPFVPFFPSVPSFPLEFETLLTFTSVPSKRVKIKSPFLLKPAFVITDLFCFDTFATALFHSFSVPEYPFSFAISNADLPSRDLSQSFKLPLYPCSTASS